MIIARKTTQPQYEEKLYSTGDDYLDELLERAFCDGYEYAQKEFGNPLNKAAKRAYEMGLGKKNEYTIMDAARNSVNKPEKFKTMNDALVNAGRKVQGGNRIPIPGFGDKIKGIDQKINVRGQMNTNNNPFNSVMKGRPYAAKTGNWKHTSQFIKGMSN